MENDRIMHNKYIKNHCQTMQKIAYIGGYNMYLAQSKVEEIIKTHLIINSNTDTFANCYYKCANKDNLMQLYNKRNHEAIFGRRGTGKTTL